MLLILNICISREGILILQRGLDLCITILFSYGMKVPQSDAVALSAGFHVSSTDIAIAGVLIDDEPAESEKHTLWLTAE